MQADPKSESLFKNIFGRVWALWALVTFVITFCIVLLPSMLAYLFHDYVKGQTYFINVSRWWMNVWLFLIGCPVTVYGRENFRPGENYVIAYNHNALLDVPLSAPYVYAANKTIAKSSFAKIPVFAWFYKRGSVLVDRKSEQSRVKSAAEMQDVLNDGMHMCIYPEGTRNRTGGPMKSFYDGAFKLAISAGKDVLPAVINGTARAMPINKTFYLYPTPLQLHFLPAVRSGGKSVHELKDEVFRTMKDAFIQFGGQ